MEFLYREVLSKDHLLEALSFFLVRVPHRDAEEDNPERPAFTILPRYHQSRMVRKVADDAVARFATTGDIGRKYLINHSAGSGKTLSICWLADRSQEGQMGVAIRVPFRKAEDPDAEDAADDEKDEEEKIAKIIREHDRNQLFVAFTATPAPATVTLFGVPFDTYTEAEAIAEGYIVDVAASIISYKTLYNLHCPIVPKPDEERLYPKGMVSKALQNVAFQDDGLIQYKAEVGKP